jgi:hypothetical protein
VEPQDADLGDRDVVGVRLGDDARVGGVAGQQRHERAVARALLLDDRLQLDRRAELQPEPAQRAHRAGHRHEAGLHVPRPAAVEPVAVAARLERRAGPQVRGGGRDDVDVAVKDEGPPAVFAVAPRRPVRDHVALARDVPGKRRRAPGGAQGFGVQGHAAGFEAALREGLFHDPLPGLLVAEDRRRPDQADEEVLHPSGLRGDGGEHGLVGGGGPSHPTLPSRIWSVFRSE